MSQPRCVLCDQPAGDDYRTFTLTPEARAAYQQRFRGSDPSPLLAKNVVCARCCSLSQDERRALASDAIVRNVAPHGAAIARDDPFRRIDIVRTIESAPITDETWEWLNLIGYILTNTQTQAAVHDKNAEWFASDDDYKRVLVRVIAKDINTLGAIFMALRCEWTHQAAALVRTLCESLITLRYIAQDKKARSRLFLGYAVIEQYKAATTLLQWDAARAKPEHVQQMKAFKAEISEKYETACLTYTFEDRTHKRRPFYNWCNKKLDQMAQETESDRLYRLVYGQTSPYVHGSAWSLRNVGALTARGYDARRALIDTSTIMRATLVVWFEWAAFCDQELGWTLATGFPPLKERLDELQAALEVAGPEGPKLQ